MGTRVWSYELRKLLYTKLTEKFGSFDKWGDYYPKDKKEEYNKFLDDIAIAFSIIMEKEITRDAVIMQIAWSTTNQGEVKGAHIYNYILNIAAAYEAGFIQSKYFPSHILVEREKPY